MEVKLCRKMYSIKQCCHIVADPKRSRSAIWLDERSASARLPAIWLVHRCYALLVTCHSTASYLSGHASSSAYFWHLKHSASQSCLSDIVPGVWWNLSGGCCGPQPRRWTGATPLSLKPEPCWRTSWTPSARRGRGKQSGSSHRSRDRTSTWMAAVAVSDSRGFYFNDTKYKPP